MAYELHLKLLQDATEYILPYLPDGVILTEDGDVSYDYYSPLVGVSATFIAKSDLYNVLRKFIIYSFAKG